MIGAILLAAATLALSPNAMSLLLTLLIPAGTALATKEIASVRVKQVVTIFLAILVALLKQSRMDNGAGVISYQMAFDSVLNFGIAVAAYLGFYRDSLNINSKALPKLGLG